MVPSKLASGASSASQRAIGTSVFWGMSVGTFLAVFLVPLFYVVVRKFFKGGKRQQEQLAAESAHAGISVDEVEQHTAEASLNDEEKRDLHDDKDQK